MNHKTDTFIGFKSNAAKKSILLSKILTDVVNKVKSDIKLVTSTPKNKGARMEISFSKYYEDSVKYEPNFHITMDYDSGYISHHNQESNSDSSLENLPESIAKPTSSKPIYLSEDALLEKPEVNSKSNLSLEIEKENYEETRNLFNSPDIVILSSVKSQETNYSGLENDSDSDVSIEIPKAKQIIVETSNNNSVETPNSWGVLGNRNVECGVNVNCDLHFCGEGDTNNCVLEYEHVNTLNGLRNENKIVANNLVDYTTQRVNNTTNVCSNKLDNNCAETSTFQNLSLSDKNNESNTFSALNNITNTCNSTLNENDSKKKLTLIFSKGSKENTYSVKRKYRSITPDKSGTPERLSVVLEKTPNSEGKLQQLTFAESDIENIDGSGISEDTEDPGKSISGTFMPERVPTILETETSENRITVNSPERTVVIGNTPKQGVNCIKNLLSVTPEKTYKNSIDPNVSPDLFVEEEPIKVVSTPLSHITTEKYITKKDQKILRRVQNGLKGVLPPLSVTVMHLSVDEMLNRLESNKEYFWTSNFSAKTDTCEESVGNLNISNESSGDELKCLLINGATVEECIIGSFPKILEGRHHGLHHNRSKLSEEFEELCAKFAQRYVGAETQSTCTVFETNIISPMKRKQLKQRWPVKSPGRRLSHLARRRITFSSANLQAGSSSMAGSRARQILVDARKLDLLRRRSPRKSPRKTPKKTPSKSPRLKSRTPSSSAKKKLAMRFRELTGEIEKTGTTSANLVLSSKRALFPSPNRDKNTSLFLPSTSGASTFKNDLTNSSTKRALFKSPSKNSPLKKSPFKRSPFKRLEFGTEKKRKRSESEDNHPSKLSKSMSVDIRPSESELKPTFPRTASDINVSLHRSAASGELSAIHKKKLQWAVYEALRTQNITPSHAQFKVFASILARVTRRFLPNLSNSAHRLEGSTSERMLRIARHHVYAVVKGKSVDEIISEYLKNRSKNIKPQGYIGIEEFASEKKKEVVNDKENVVQGRINTIASLEKKKLSQLGVPKTGSENRIERIRKVINFGDDNR